MGVRRLAGKYSAVKRPNTPIASENTAVHAADTGSMSTGLAEPSGLERSTKLRIALIQENQ
jgi:hypothetical protein